jgi:hypothetical protein
MIGAIFMKFGRAPTISINREGAEGIDMRPAD